MWEFNFSPKSFLFYIWKALSTLFKRKAYSQKLLIFVYKLILIQVDFVLCIKENWNEKKIGKNKSIYEEHLP